MSVRATEAGERSCTSREDKRDDPLGNRGVRIREKVKTPVFKRWIYPNRCRAAPDKWHQFSAPRASALSPPKDSISRR